MITIICLKKLKIIIEFYIKYQYWENPKMHEPDKPEPE